MELITCYEHWNNWGGRYGSFQTALFTAYQNATETHRPKLRAVFPEWFVEKRFEDKP